MRAPEGNCHVPPSGYVFFPSFVDTDQSRPLFHDAQARRWKILALLQLSTNRRTRTPTQRQRKLSLTKLKLAQPPAVQEEDPTAKPTKRMKKKKTTLTEQSVAPLRARFSVDLFGVLMPNKDFFCKGTAMSIFFYYCATRKVTAAHERAFHFDF